MKAYLDRYITLNYQKLVCIAQKMSNEFNRGIQGETIVTNAYLSLIDKPPKHESDIERYLVQAIKFETMYPNSKTIKEEYGRKHEELNERLRSCNTVDELIHIIDLETEYKAFMDRLTLEEQIVCEVYMLKGKKTIRDIAEHFGIPRTSMHEHVKGMIDKFKRFEDESKERIRRA